MADVGLDMIFDNLGFLILDLKKKNDAMEIFLCELVSVLRLDDLTGKIN